MKTNIHPKWNHQATVKCACGYSFQTGLSQDDLYVDICGKCHPFFTGEMRFVDVQGRVDRFKNRQQIAQNYQKKKKTDKKADKNQAEVKSLKELLSEEKKKIVEPKTTN